MNKKKEFERAKLNENRLIRDKVTRKSIVVKEHINDIETTKLIDINKNGYYKYKK